MPRKCGDQQSRKAVFDMWFSEAKASLDPPHCSVKAAREKVTGVMGLKTRKCEK
jgi:hypothetical protein